MLNQGDVEDGPYDSVVQWAKALLATSAYLVKHELVVTAINLDVEKEKEMRSNSKSDLH